MRKSLQLQAEMAQEFGACVFDVTLDCEDGAPVGGEAEHAALVTELALGAGRGARVAVRVHPVDHPAFDAGRADHRRPGRRAPVPRHAAQGRVACTTSTRAARRSMPPARRSLPLHALIESPAAVHRAFDIAAHPRIQSLSFGLMDFVSAHGGAIPEAGMGVQGQFTHPLVVRAKLEIASACHAHGKVPSHCVVTEFKDRAAMAAAAAARQRASSASRACGASTPTRSGRSWRRSRPAPARSTRPRSIVAAAQAADWAPISVDGKLHDRASYRYLLAGARAGAPDRPDTSRRGRRLVRRPRPMTSPGASMQIRHLVSSLHRRGHRRQPRRVRAGRQGRRQDSGIRQARSQAQAGPVRAEGRRGSHAGRRRPERAADRSRPGDRPSRCYVGDIRCELGASVKVAPARRTGLFVVTTKGYRFLMHPVESRTGAIRLEDPRARRDVAAAGQQVDAHEPEAGPAPGRRMPEPAAAHRGRGAEAQPAPQHPGRADAGHAGVHRARHRDAGRQHGHAARPARSRRRRARLAGVAAKN